MYAIRSYYASLQFLAQVIDQLIIGETAILVDRQVLGDLGERFALVGRHAGDLSVVVDRQGQDAVAVVGEESRRGEHEATRNNFV